MFVKRAIGWINNKTVIVLGGISKRNGEENEAARKDAAEASAHNAGQPIVLLPDALQKMIIDLLPIGR